MNIIDLIDVKNLIFSFTIFIVLISILIIFFIIPTKKNLEQTLYRIEDLKQKIELHNRLLPIYIKVSKELDRLEKDIHISPKKISLTKFEEQIFNNSSKFNLNVLSITPELNKDSFSSGLMRIEINLNSKFIDCIHWIEFLLEEGYIYKIYSIKMDSNINKLNVRFIFYIRV